MAIESMRQAWNAYTRNFWTMIAALLLCVVIILILVIPMGVAFGVYMIQMGIPNNPAAFSYAMMNPALIAGFVIVSILLTIVIMELYAGMIGLAKNSLGRRPSLNVMLRTMKKKFWNILGLNVILAVIILAVFLVTMIPFFALMASAQIVAGAVAFLVGMVVTALVGLFFMLSNQALVCSDLTIIDSIKTSFNIVKKNYLDFFVLVLIFFVAAFLIGFMPIAGFLINWFLVLPLLIISMTVFYLNRKKAIEQEMKLKERDRLKRKLVARARRSQAKKK